MKSELTFEWKLIGIDGTTGFAYSSKIPRRKVEGLFYPDGEEGAICAFNSRTGETLTVRQFNTISNYCSWHHKTTQGWTLVDTYKYLGALTEVTFSAPAPAPVPAPVEDEDDYWG